MGLGGLRFQVRAACFSVEMPRTERMYGRIDVLSYATRWAIWIGGPATGTSHRSPRIEVRFHWELQTLYPLRLLD